MLLSEEFLYTRQDGHMILKWESWGYVLRVAPLWECEGKLGFNLVEEVYNDDEKKWHIGDTFITLEQWIVLSKFVVRWNDIFESVPISEEEENCLYGVCKTNVKELV